MRQFCESEQYKFDGKDIYRLVDNLGRPKLCGDVLQVLPYVDGDGEATSALICPTCDCATDMPRVRDVLAP